MSSVIPVILLLSPLVAGYLFAPISSAVMAVLRPSSALWLLNLLFALYWFWVGSYFARLKAKPLFSFLCGILPSAIGLLLYVYEFYLTKTKSLLLALLPQLYVTYLVTWSARLAGVFHITSRPIDSRAIMAIANLLMGLIFSAGYLRGCRGRSSNSVHDLHFH